MTPHEQDFRRLLRSMLRRGIKPTPTTINRYLGRTGRKRLNHINGREAAWRREELLAAGWLEPMHIFDEHYNITSLGHWQPPR